MHTQLCSFCSALHSSLAFPVGGVVNDRKEWAGGLLLQWKRMAELFPADSPKPNKWGQFWEPKAGSLWIVCATQLTA